MNLQKWNSLAKDVQDIIVEEAKKGAKWTFDEGQKVNEDDLRWMEKEKGLVVNWKPDIESFRRKGEDAYIEFKKQDWYNTGLVETIRALK